MTTANWKPRDYQVKDLGFHIANPKSLNLSDPGTGKTPTACWWLWYHWHKHDRKSMWTMPKSLMKKNKAELLKFTDFAENEVIILESDHRKLLARDTNVPLKQRTKKVKKLTGRTNPDGSFEYMTTNESETVVDLIAIAAKTAKVIITTFKFVSMHWEHLLKIMPDIDAFCVDELHMGYAGPTSDQTDSFYWVNRNVSQFLGLTGTIVDGRLDSVFPAIHVIEPRYYGSYGGFVNEHAGWINDYGKVEYWVREEKVRSILERHAVRHSFEEVYGDEPVYFIPLKETTGPMGPKLRSEYDKFHDQAMLELLDGSVLDGALPGVATIRATQIMSHPETMGIAHAEALWKDEKLAAFAAEGRPMLVFASLQPEQERCKKVLEGEGLRVGLINANVSAKQRNQIDEDFCSGKLDAIVGSGPTVAVGYNWERADLVVFVSVDYKDTNALQAYRRASRGTRTTTLRVAFLAYEDSVDQRKFDILTEKSVLANKVDPTRKVLHFAR